MRENLFERYPSLRETIEKGEPVVTHLDLYNHGLNDDDISDLQEALQRNSYINSLDLSNNMIADKGCQILRSIPGLRKIDLSCNHITDKGVAYLLGIRIEWLNVSRCAITDEGAILLLKHIDQFKYLEIWNNRHISEDLEYQINKNFIPNLVHPAISRARREAWGIPDLGLWWNLGLWPRNDDHRSVEMVFDHRPPAP